MNIATIPNGCLKCGGQELWDNRSSKANPKSPDWKCKNKSCGEAYWFKPNGQAPVQQQQAYAQPAPQPQYSSPPPPQYAAPLAQGYDPQSPPALNQAPPQAAVQYAASVAKNIDAVKAAADVLWATVLEQSDTLVKNGVGDSPEAASARLATMLIQACGGKK